MPEDINFKRNTVGKGNFEIPKKKEKRSKEFGVVGNWVCYTSGLMWGSYTRRGSLKWKVLWVLVEEEDSEALSRVL